MDLKINLTDLTSKFPQLLSKPPKVKIIIRMKSIKGQNNKQKKYKEGKLENKTVTT